MTEDDLGKCKAQVMVESLHELNPTDTEGAFIDMPVDKFIDQVGDAIWGDQFTLVIGSDFTNEQALKVSKRCSTDISEVQSVIPFVLIRQYGLIGYVRVILDEICVAE